MACTKLRQYDTRTRWSEDLLSCKFDSTYIATGERALSIDDHMLVFLMWHSRLFVAPSSTNIK